MNKRCWLFDACIDYETNSNFVTYKRTPSLTTIMKCVNLASDPNTYSTCEARLTQAACEAADASITPEHSCIVECTGIYTVGNTCVKSRCCLNAEAVKPLKPPLAFSKIGSTGGLLPITEDFGN